MHLIYARFITMFLFDIGVIDFQEPFKKVIHQGMITKDGHKMSKSRGNTVNPDEYDPDELRMYLMFIGHYFEGGDWDDSRIKGVRRALNKWAEWLKETGGDDEEKFALGELQDKIHGYVEAWKLNKVVSTLMEFYNNHKHLKPNAEVRHQIMEIISCFAPGFVNRVERK